MDVTKKASKIVIETLTSSDYIGLVDFDSTAKKYKNTMIRATTDNKEDIYKWIDKIEMGGYTNFEAGFDAAYEIMSDTKKDEYGVDCSNIILFLTDGNVTKGTELAKY